nr:MAG TPA: hypothetical protein [Caudoviricetes sp.]
MDGNADSLSTSRNENLQPPRRQSPFSESIIPKRAALRKS